MISLARPRTHNFEIGPSRLGQHLANENRGVTYLAVQNLKITGNGCQTGGASNNYHDLKVFKIIEKNGTQNGD